LDVHKIFNIQLGFFSLLLWIIMAESKRVWLDTRSGISNAWCLKFIPQIRFPIKSYLEAIKPQFVFMYDFDWAWPYLRSQEEKKYFVILPKSCENE
jgi:hypothetical protein